MELTKEVLQTLGAPFSEDEIDFLPRAQSNGKALGLAYIDARAVMNRLDFAVGGANWSFDYDVVSPDGKMVRGKLTVCGITKCDAGESGPEDEPLKSAVSDALKRCAVHFGIGRYLHYLPKVWAPYDAQKRRFTEPPKLDRSAVARALASCGFGEHHAPPQPESRGDQRATGQQKAAQATRSAEQSRSYAEEAGAKEKEPNPRGKYHALLKEHGCDDLTDEQRHLFNGLILGKPGPWPTKNWRQDTWDKFLPRLEKHCVDCPGGGLCDARQAAKDAAPTQEAEPGFRSALASP